MKEYLRAVDMQISQKTSPLRGRCPLRVLFVPTYHVFRSVRRRIPSKAIYDVAESSVFRLFRRTQPSPHVRRNPHLSKLLACLQLAECCSIHRGGLWAPIRRPRRSSTLLCAFVHVDLPTREPQAAPSTCCSRRPCSPGLTTGYRCYNHPQYQLDAHA